MIGSSNGDEIKTIVAERSMLGRRKLVMNVILLNSICQLGLADIRRFYFIEIISEYIVSLDIAGGTLPGFLLLLYKAGDVVKKFLWVGRTVPGVKICLYGKQVFGH